MIKLWGNGHFDGHIKLCTYGGEVGSSALPQLFSAINTNRCRWLSHDDFNTREMREKQHMLNEIKALHEAVRTITRMIVFGFIFLKSGIMDKRTKLNVCANTHVTQLYFGIRITRIMHFWNILLCSQRLWCKETKLIWPP